ncbi:nuclease-related domain-containing protein [Neobacillus drentensis]|uniref:nuclease-related domain-containing protein n=1 Tax=Neobacillus drentensis TaxID=220684 RepID=UPI003000B654
MFAKECTLPILVQKHEALDTRIIPNHPIRPTLINEYKSRLAGYKGEKSLDFYLSMLPEEKYLIFHSLRIPLGNYYFQIDILLLTTTFGLVLEVKNRIGEYHFKKYLNQTTIQTHGKEERIKNPVLQAKLQALKLSKWLKKNHYDDYPIYYLFVNSNEKALIKAEQGNESILRFICNSEGLVEKINQIANMNQKEKLNEKELRKLKRLLLASHTPDNTDILEHFHLSQDDVLTGVHCPMCRCLAMSCKNGTWVCPHCKYKSKTAHIEAINHYFLLYKRTITNKELRHFLQIDSPKTANRILRQLGLAYSGTYKDRKYFQS